MVDVFGNEVVVGVRSWLPAGAYIDAVVGTTRSMLFSPTIPTDQRLRLIADLVLREPSTWVLAHAA